MRTWPRPATQASSLAVQYPAAGGGGGARGDWRQPLRAPSGGNKAARDRVHHQSRAHLGSPLKTCTQPCTAVNRAPSAQGGPLHPKDPLHPLTLRAPRPRRSTCGCRRWRPRAACPASTWWTAAAQTCHARPTCSRTANTLGASSTTRRAAAAGRRRRRGRGRRAALNHPAGAEARPGPGHESAARCLARRMPAVAAPRRRGSADPACQTH